MKVQIKEIILEARAIDRRQDAISKGIVPINGTNWNADRKNPKKITNALNLGNKIKRIDNTITKYGNISPNKEYSGTIENGKIDPRIIGTRQSVYGVNGQTTFHKHPNNIKLRQQDDYTSNYFKNRPISTPSGIPNEKLDMFSNGDYMAATVNALKNKNKKHTEFIFSPNTKSNTVAQINTTAKNIQTEPIQKTSYFSNKAKKYYDLNGNLKHGANDYTNPASFLSINNIPDTKLINNIKELKAFKIGENRTLNAGYKMNRTPENSQRNQEMKEQYPDWKTLFERAYGPAKNALRTGPIDFKEVNSYFDKYGKDDRRKMIDNKNYQAPFNKDGYRENIINRFRWESPYTKKMFNKNNSEDLHYSMYKDV